MNLIGANTNLLFILLPLFVAQYALATFALTRLVYCRFSTGIYVAWNITILLAFFVGSISFLIFYFASGARKKAEAKLAAEDAKKDAILIDAPLYDETNDVSQESLKTPQPDDVQNKNDK